MDLRKIINDTELLGITIIFYNIPTVKGRYTITNDKHCIYVDKNLSDIEKINVILHELAHFINNDLSNNLTFVPTYSHRIEHETEKARIIDFMNLVNQEYPIDQNFNYIEYMKSACIPSEYEFFVREISQNFYQENLEKGII
ncbi:ImmA/IrrE family metallo-endopeptidase [Streptococcus acidominimus]|uniref:ImmA/IrrE family metallo-endopeptidase n=1 Tax=Streptococcus acidominimus TaxID=1326 RepID=A0A4Y9FTK4_STRAI|nr:ImmA/IrrE family metallo-endopeptidase [Streptococcus acidominimus]MBF0817854.1 ImmA/IrrE family metallo-endopeptidase [Streptococcus acidominimus]MBF0838370.1 ImmA/IrrE family metallo-endopeptidase [Streptococcus acidominimus]MBF0846267.1 ImmA/IrrE family metallo-endopeptidase [Streptococcus danieliae]TFU31843.1 ImmA/IrrE family metallo-endopeptidase [Streptococcus acidominimus]